MAAGGRLLPETRRPRKRCRPWKKSTARTLPAAIAGSRPGLTASHEGGRGRRRIDRVLGPRLEEAENETGFDGLRRFVAFFGNQPQASAARAQLVSA